jgi:hypothetical protein
MFDLRHEHEFGIGDIKSVKNCITPTEVKIRILLLQSVLGLCHNNDLYWYGNIPQNIQRSHLCSIYGCGKMVTQILAVLRKDSTHSGNELLTRTFLRNK